jgi:hypothetical protein
MNSTIQHSQQWTGNAARVGVVVFVLAAHEEKLSCREPLSFSRLRELALSGGRIRGSIFFSQHQKCFINL